MDLMERLVQAVHGPVIRIMQAARGVRITQAAQGVRITQAAQGEGANKCWLGVALLLEKDGQVHLLG